MNTPVQPLHHPAENEDSLSHEQSPASPSVKHDKISSYRAYINAVLAREVSRLTRYYDNLIQWRPRANDTMVLLDNSDCHSKQVAFSNDDLPNLSSDYDKDKRSVILLNGNINHDSDIQGTLKDLKEALSRSSRILLIAYNPYFKLLYRLANILGIRSGEQPSTFVTHTDLDNIAKLAGFELISSRPAVYCPFKLGGLGNLINRIFPTIPILRWFGLVSIVTLRPLFKESTQPSLSIVIPARNEKGNIENALKRMPSFHGAEIEVIFVEGHSSDDTWEEIQRVKEAYSDRFDIKILQQPGKGKSDAVRVGFGQAKHKLLTILDADLTMPPELLERYYEAYCDGLADFINGSRLVYPMEGQAMRFLNHLGNIFFAKALSFVLDTSLGDSLCGTKLVSASDYRRFCAWRADFGDVDPFGDFELIFPAAELGLGLIDIPIMYRDRTYGSTNISRFRHGIQLARMTLIGLVKIKAGKYPTS